MSALRRAKRSIKLKKLRTRNIYHVHEPVERGDVVMKDGTKLKQAFEYCRWCGRAMKETI